MVELDKPATYLVYPLAFGGFISIEPESISVYKKKLKAKHLLTKQLRKPLQVKAIAQIDEFDPKTNKTADGRALLRYIFGTTCGELYLLAFDLSLLAFHIDEGRSKQGFNSDKFMIVEYLGSRLSNC
jgi:hypothetical protein